MLKNIFIKLGFELTKEEQKIVTLFKQMVQSRNQSDSYPYITNYEHETYSDFNKEKYNFLFSHIDQKPITCRISFLQSYGFKNGGSSQVLRVKLDLGLERHTSYEYVCYEKDIYENMSFAFKKEFKLIFDPLIQDLKDNFNQQQQRLEEQFQKKSIDLIDNILSNQSRPVKTVKNGLHLIK